MHWIFSKQAGGVAWALLALAGLGVATLPRDVVVAAGGRMAVTDTDQNIAAHTLMAAGNVTKAQFASGPIPTAQAAETDVLMNVYTPVNVDMPKAPAPERVNMWKLMTFGEDITFVRPRYTADMLGAESGVRAEAFAKNLPALHMAGPR